jgi:small conductance mechanosensitive channel
MSSFTWIRSQLADGRFDANLIAVYGLIVFLTILSLILRRLLVGGHSALSERTGFHWLKTWGGEATRHARRLILGLTIIGVVVVAVGGLAYHLAGRDIRQDLENWYADLTLAEVFALGLRAVGIVLAALAARYGVRLVRRVRPVCQAHVVKWLGAESKVEVVQKWFSILERYVSASVRLLATLAAMEIARLGPWATSPVAFLFTVMTILVGARLLTMAGRVLTKLGADLGDHYLTRGQVALYWERVKRLVPFGERCFEAAVYVAAASLCVAALHIIRIVPTFGSRIVLCIGILFTTRVVIELLQVLLNQAFGLYDEAPREDQKGRTLVPLLYSVCQYVLYFGAGIGALTVLDINTAPILAGAGVIGLAVGLGAQSLVTDVVSGFFILFEEQYLVGDFVQIGDAVGIVEAVGIRLTQIRDGQGKLYILPNGQIKGVVNYSKGYVNAVVDLRVPTGTDLEKVFRAMTEAGRHLRQARKEVLADTVVQGLVDLGTSDMTVRAVTRVKPGTHIPMQNEYRRMLKMALDQPAVANRAEAA